MSLRNQTIFYIIIAVVLSTSLFFTAKFFSAGAFAAAVTLLVALALLYFAVGKILDAVIFARLEKSLARLRELAGLPPAADPGGPSPDGALYGIDAAADALADKISDLAHNASSAARRFGSVFGDNPYMAIISARPDGTVTGWNFMISSLTGFGPSEVVGIKKFPGIIFGCSDSLGPSVNGADFAVSFAGEFAAVFRDGKPRTVRELEIRDRHGAAKWIDGTLVPIFEADAVTEVIFECLDVTERKNAEVELEAAKNNIFEIVERFESVIRDTPLVAIQGFNRDGIIYHWNDASASLFGYKSAEVIENHRIQDLLFKDEEIAKNFVGDYLGVWEKGVSSAAREWRVVDRQGGEHWIWAVIFPIFEKGIVVEVYFMNVDITERKKAEALMQRSHEELEMIVAHRTCELQNEIVDRKMAEERLEKLNRVFANLGMDFESNINMLVRVCGELLGAGFATYDRMLQGWLCNAGAWNIPENFEPIGIPEGRLACDAIRNGAKGGILILGNLDETSYADSDPLVRPYALKNYIGSPVHSGGKCVGCLSLYYYSERTLSKYETGIIEMITAAIVQEEDRRSSEEKVRILSLAVEKSPSLIFITDVSGKIEYVNAKFTEITGYSLAEVAGKTPSFLKSGKTPAEEYKKMWKTIVSGFSWGGDLTNRKKNGDFFADKKFIVPIQQNGVTTHFISMSEDVTNRKRMEEEVLKVTKLESLGVLAGGLAHDFNNFLTGIMGNISLAISLVEQKGQVYEILSKAEDITFEAKNLTTQLMSIARGGAQNKKIMRLQELIRNVVNFSLRGTNCRPELSIAENLWPAEIDSGQINQVITNLVINAAQASPNGGTVRISAANTTFTGPEGSLKAGNYIEIAVGDNGVGISPENISRIFDPYFTTKPKGNGLGLSSVFSIVTKHEGTITVESKVGEGSTFKVFLPALPEKESALAKKETVRPKALAKGPEASAASGVAGKKVLVMDDEESIRNVTAQLLTHLGFSVMTACNGEEAVELYKKSFESGQKFDVLIMDLTITGGMGGVDAINAIRQIDPKVKAIAASGYFAEQAAIADFKKAGFVDFVTKPFKIADLKNIIIKIVSEEK